MVGTNAVIVPTPGFCCPETNGAGSGRDEGAVKACPYRTGNRKPAPLLSHDQS